ncbi:MAG: PQQ-binding-like beta-propeller repeat protein [Thermoanaerobaculia bacterium]
MRARKLIHLALAAGPLAVQPLFVAADGAVGLLESWPEDGPEKLWQVPLGGGFSGLTIVDGRLFTVFSRDRKEIVGAFDAASGEQVWTVAIDRERKDRWGSGPRSTPLYDDGVVYAVSALGHLTALKSADGARLWSRYLQRDLDARVPTWGVSASPIVDGDLLLFNVGGDGRAVVAFDKKTGDVVWQAGDDLAGYSTPIAFTAAGIRQAVFFSGSKIIAVAPSSGEILWTQRWKTAYDINAATPIFIAPDKLFVSSAQDKGSALFRNFGDEGTLGVTPLWKSAGMQNQFSSSVYHDGYIYGFDDKHLKCIAVRDGEARWRQGGLGHGSLFYADGHLVVLGDGGQLRLIEASPVAVIEKAAGRVANGKHWTVPTLYGGKLFVRNERDLYCFELSESAEPPMNSESRRRRGQNP